MNQILRQTLLKYEKDPDVLAFLRVIRERESSQTDDAYRMRWTPRGVAYFNDFKDHPRIDEPRADGRTSSASGAYQFTRTTWDDVVSSVGSDLLPDFSPASQDRAAVALLIMRGVFQLLMVDDVQGAIVKARPTWTSLPGASESSASWTMAKALEVFVKWGGGRKPQAPAPIEIKDITPEEPMAPAAIPLLIALGQQLIQLFTPLAQQKIAAAINKAAGSGDPTLGENVAKAALNTAQQALGIPNAANPVATAVNVVAEAQKDNPAAQAAIANAEQATMDYLDKIAPFVDKMHQMSMAEWAAGEDSMDRAAARAIQTPAEDWMAKTLVGGILLISGFLILLVSGVAIAQITLLPSRSPTTEVWAALTGVIGTTLGILGTVFAFRFGTNRASAGKDFIITELSKRQR